MACIRPRSPTLAASVHAATSSCQPDSNPWAPLREKRVRRRRPVEPVAHQPDRRFVLHVIRRVHGVALNDLRRRRQQPRNDGEIGRGWAPRHREWATERERSGLRNCRLILDRVGPLLPWAVTGNAIPWVSSQAKRALAYPVRDGNIVIGIRAAHVKPQLPPLMSHRARNTDSV